MEPIVCEFLASICLGLSNFVLMVWKYEITTTHMDIDLCTKKFQITGTTLDVPAWTTLEDFFLSVYCDLDLP